MFNCAADFRKVFSMTEQVKRELVDRYIDAYNRCNIDGMIAQLHRDIAFLNITNSVVTDESDGIDQFRELALRSRALFSSRQQTVISFKAAADQAEVEISFIGVLAVDLPNG